MTSLPTQIETLIVARLGTVTTADDAYAVSVSQIIQPLRREIRSFPGGTAVIEPDTFRQDDDLIDSLGVKKQRGNTWSIDYFVEPSDGSEIPYSSLRFQAIAEIERALALDFTNDNAFSPYNGLARTARLLAPQLFDSPDGGTAGVRINLQIDYVYQDQAPDQPA